MASTISTINQTLVDARVVEALRYVLPALNAFSLGVDANGKIQSDVVYVPIATDPSATSKTPGTMVTAGGTVAGTAVTLSNFYGASWDANEGSMSARVLPQYWADKAAGSVYVLAKQVVDAALGLVTASNYSNVEGTDKLTCAPADFGPGDLALLWQYAELKIKQRQRTLLLNAPYAAALMGETNLSLIFATAGGNNALATGVLPQLIGMNTLAYAALPGNSQSLGGVVLGKAAILVGVAPPEPLAAAGEGDISERRMITDPESGITVMYTQKVSAGGNIQGECCLLYGVAKGQDAAVRLVGA